MKKVVDPAKFLTANVDRDVSAIAKLSFLVHKINASPKLIRKLQALMGDDYLAPYLDVATRWNSTHAMLVRAKLFRNYFWDVFQEINQKPIRECTQNLILSNRDWVLVDEVIAILEPFKFVTDELSKSSLNLTIATMIPLYQHCVSSLETEINMVLETGEKVYDEKDDMYVAMNLAKEKIIHYYDGASPILGIAAILDPRLKKERFEFWQWEEEWIATAMEHFKEAFEIYKAKVTSAKISNTDTPLNPIMPQLPIHVAIYGLPKSKMQPQKEEYERL
jgi:hypothetical protein